MREAFFGAFLNGTNCFIIGVCKNGKNTFCVNCLSGAGISILSNALSYNQQSIKELINVRKKLVNNFSNTKSVGTYISVDENNKAFKIGRDIFAYDNLLSFELLEDGQSITKGV